MNRTTLAHRVAVLAVAAVLTCGWPQAADAQNMPEPPSKVFKAYHLRYVNPADASSWLHGLMGEDLRSSIRMSVGPNGTLLVFATPDAYKRIEDVLKAIDVAPAAEPEAQIKIFALVHADPASAAKMLVPFLPKNSRVAADERTRSLIVSGSPETIGMAAAVLTRLDEKANSEQRPKPPASYEVRILWLANDAKGTVPADDLKDVVAELSRLGVKDPRQIGQMVVQTSSGQAFQLSSLPNFAGQPAKLTASGRLSEQSEGVVGMDISIQARRGEDNQQQQNLSNLQTRIVVPQKQYVVLAIAPVGDVTSVFVIQVTDRAKGAEKK